MGQRFKTVVIAAALSAFFAAPLPTATISAATAATPEQQAAAAKLLGEAVEMMHVWIFDNPDGPYAHSLTAAGLQAAVRFAGRTR